MSMTQELTRRSKIDTNYWRFRRERYVQDKGDRMLSSLVISHAAIRIQPQAVLVKAQKHPQKHGRMQSHSKINSTR